MDDTDWFTNKQVSFPCYSSEQCGSFSEPSGAVNRTPFFDNYPLILYVVSTHQTLIDVRVEEYLCWNMSINKQLYSGSLLELLIMAGNEGEVALVHTM